MKKTHRRFFTLFAEIASAGAGSPISFIIALLFIIGWAITGPMFHYSESWQIVVNTATTIVTFLLVFLIQNSQNRETRAIQLKLDELIRANKHAHSTFMHLEKLTDEELELLRSQYEALAEEARRRLEQGESDQYAPEVELRPTGSSG